MSEHSHNVTEALRTAIMNLQYDADNVAKLADDDNALIDAAGRQLYGEGAGTRLVRALYTLINFNPVSKQVDSLKATRPAL